MVDKLEIQPIIFREACAFVAKYHRHNKAPRGHKFSVAVYRGKRLVGVAMVGRPIARHDDDGRTLEINRTCVNGRPETRRNANSMLYGAARRAAWALGYLRVLTYTQLKEKGSSLHAAGYIRVRELKPRPNWVGSSGKKGTASKIKRDPNVLGNVARVLWEVRRGS